MVGYWFNLGPINIFLGALVFWWGCHVFKRGLQRKKLLWLIWMWWWGYCIVILGLSMMLMGYDSLAHIPI